LAFQQVNYDTTRSFGFDNFTRFFTEFVTDGSIAQLSVKNSVIFFLVGIFIALPLSIFLSYFLFKKIWLHSFFRVVLFLPAIISAVVFATLYRYIVDPNLGLVNQIISFITSIPKSELPNWLADDRYKMFAIVIFSLWTGLSINIVLFSGAISRIPGSIFEVNKIEGTGMWDEIVKVVIPMIWPTLTTTFILSTAGIFTFMGPILLLDPPSIGKGISSASTIAYYIFFEVKNNAVLEYPAAIGLVFTLIGVPIIISIKKVLDKIGSDVEY
jgi:ABC-type sugar transport system permease subunit